MDPAPRTKCAAPPLAARGKAKGRAGFRILTVWLYMCVGGDSGPQMPQLVRHYIPLVVVGCGLSAIFASLLLWSYVANLWLIVSRLT